MTWLRRLYRNEVDIDFRRPWRIGLGISAVLMVLSVGFLVGRGLNLGLDFEGGAAWELPANGVDIEEVRDVMAEFGLEDARIQTGDDTLRVRAEIDAEDQQVTRIAAELAQLTGVDVDEVTTTVVGPSWGEEITEKAVRALVVFFVVIAVYISVRLQWKLAVGALASVAHDLLLTVGIYAAFHFTVAPATVIAILTILGYSLYDTLVVFDRVHENEHRLVGAGKHTYTEVMNLSLNQVLARSVNTSIVSLLPVVSVLVVGAWILDGATLSEFAIALFVGLTTGALSSVFIAAPVAAYLKEREPRWREIRNRLAARSAGDARRPSRVTSTASVALTTAAPVDAPEEAIVTATEAASALRSPTGTIPPRPRKPKAKPKPRR